MMVRLFVQLGAWSVFGLFAGMVLAWHFAFRSPALNLLPLPPALVSVGSPSGHAYLTESRFIKDHLTLNRAFEPQVRREYSGVASAVMVLNALRHPEPPITQTSFFIDPVRKIRRPLWVSFTGMNLEDFRDAVRFHGVDAEAQFAAETDIDSFRSIVRENLITDSDFLIVNYTRKILHQEGGEHFAPVAAYHDPTDRGCCCSTPRSRTTRPSG